MILFAIDLMVSLVLNTVTRRVSTADMSSISRDREVFVKEIHASNVT